MFATRQPARLLFAAAIILTALFLIGRLLPLEGMYAAFMRLLAELGGIALALYACVYIVATLIMVPLAPLAIAAGYLFGLYTAFTVSLLAATFGALLAFLISRHWLAATFHRILLRHPVMHAVERSIAEQGWLIVFLLRLSPVIPSHLLNYLCGITEIPVRHYFGATLLGKAPLIFLLSYLGATTAQSLEQQPETGNGQLLLYSAGLIFTAIACWLVARRARQLLQRQGLIDE